MPSTESRKARVIEVVIADKSPLVQNGLRNLFEADERFRIVATATDGERFLAAVERMKFDVGIIGWEMPYLDGRGVLASLRDHPHPPRILVYTGNSNPSVPREVMNLGGAGFCHKSEPLERLMEAVWSIAEGRMIFPFFDVRQMAESPLGSLTARERELLEALANGRTNAQLARELDISLNTVKFHLKNLFEKMGVDNRTQAAAKYLQQGGI